MICAALGCGKPAAKKKMFCMKHWRKLPTELRPGEDFTATGTDFREAVIFLGKKDGFLADVPARRVELIDVPEQEDV